MQVSLNNFDRGKPFYPLIVLYLAQLAGFKELAVLGIKGVERRISIAPSVIGEDESAAEQMKNVEAQITKVLGPLQLRSEFQASTIDIEIPVLAAEITQQTRYLTGSLSKAAGHVLILAHELAKEGGHPDGSPLWEFLRHCRNAAAHGGRFNLVGDEPRRPATWGKFKVERGLNGTGLMKDETGAGLLSIGDPIRLLWDIEQANPSMRA